MRRLQDHHRQVVQRTDGAKHIREDERTFTQMGEQGGGLESTQTLCGVSQQRQVKIPSSIKIAVNTFTIAFLNIKCQCSSRAKMIESQFIRLMKSFSSQNPLCLKILSSKSTADAESSRALQRI